MKLGAEHSFLLNVNEKVSNYIPLETMNKSAYPCPNPTLSLSNDVVIKWKLFPRYWPFVRGIHRLPVKSPHKGQWDRWIPRSDAASDACFLWYVPE